MGNRRAQDLAVARPQPVDRHLHGRLSQVQACGDRRVRQSRLLPRKTVLEVLEKFRPAGGGVFLLQPSHGLIEQRRGPLPVEEHIGRHVVRGFRGEARLRQFLVNGHHRREATALLRVFPVPFVGQETLERHQ